MKRKITCILVACMATMMLGGCAELVDMPELSDEESELVTEYAAGLVLKYDGSFSSRLLSDEELAKEEAKELEAIAKENEMKAAAEKYLNAKKNATKDEEPAATPNAGGAAPSSSDVAVSNVADFYGQSGFSVSYTGYELCDSYPNAGRDDYFMAMDATDGKQFCVLKFNVVNSNAQAAEFDMFDANPSISAYINGEKLHAQYTLLPDDLAAYKGELEPGADNEMVLIFEVDDDMTSVDSLQLSLKNGDSKGTMDIM